MKNGCFSWQHKLAEIFARSLGYDRALVMAKDYHTVGIDADHFTTKYTDLVLGFEKSKMRWWDKGPLLKDSEGNVLTADMTVTAEDVEGIKAAYAFFAEEIYKALVDNKTLHLDGTEVRAGDVPEFMVECALNGIGCLENREETCAV